ncbi:MAG: methyltransferase domain-containing protein [Woeseiaceae bacterium]|nr:methyltransferase domain-containing protein [Woeseiaceae bacterium]
MQSTEAFWNKIAPKYARTEVRNEQVYTRKLKITQSYLKPDMRVLEFGCGTGTTALHHAPLVKEYIATDIAREMIRIAEQKCSANNVANVQIFCWNDKQRVGRETTIRCCVGVERYALATRLAHPA